GTHEVHHLVPAGTRRVGLDDQIFDRVAVVVDLPLIQDVWVEGGGARFGWRNEAGHRHDQDDVVRVDGAAEGVDVGDVGGVIRGKEGAVLVIGRLDPSSEADGRGGRERQAPRDRPAAPAERGKGGHGSLLVKGNGRRAT